MGALVCMRSLAVRFESFKTPAAGARAPRPSEDFRPDPYGCSPVRSSLTVAGLAFDILREPARTINGSILAYVSSCTRCRAARRAPPPLVGLRSRTGGGHARSAPPRDLSDGPRPCGVWGVGSGQSDAGPACTCHELSRTRLVASAELKTAANVHLTAILGSKAQCETRHSALTVTETV